LQPSLQGQGNMAAKLGGFVARLQWVREFYP
jgi:hypothetical protein